jgi:hypothetical protein
VLAAKSHCHHCAVMSGTGAQSRGRKRSFACADRAVPMSRSILECDSSQIVPDTAGTDGAVGDVWPNVDRFSEKPGWWWSRRFHGRGRSRTSLVDRATVGSGEECVPPAKAEPVNVPPLRAVVPSVVLPL